LWSKTKTTYIDEKTWSGYLREVGKIQITFTSAKKHAIVIPSETPFEIRIG